MCLNKKADGIVDDIGIAAYLIEPGRSSYSLKAVAERYLAANNGGNAADLQALLPLIEQNCGIMNCINYIRKWNCRWPICWQNGISWN